MDTRHTELLAWARQEIERLLDSAVGEITLHALSGDASFRRYFRVLLPDNSFIVVDAPPQTEDNAAFVRIADALRRAGVHAPTVHAVDAARGFMLQEDFGDQLLLQTLRASHDRPDLADRLYKRAIDALVRMQKNVSPHGFPDYDQTLLMREMQLFQDWFCARFLGLELDPGELALVRQCQEFLAREALSQPRVVVHRDYHSRNLMIPNVARYGADFYPGVIDFQDAVYGPYTYDLVSLLRDCYISWPPGYVQALALYYKEQAEGEGVIAAIGQGSFFRDFDIMGLQRHMKVIGIFARLCIRDRKPGFLADIPQTIRYFLEVAENHPELQGFTDWFRHRVLPLSNARLPVPVP